MRRWREVLPWLLAAAVLGWLLARHDPRLLANALVGADVAHFAVLLAGFVLLWLVLDAAILAALFTRLGARTPFARMLVLRGSTYPAMAVSYDLASAALVALLARASGAPLSRVGAGMLVHYACDVTALATVASLASLSAHGAVVAALRPLLGALALGLGALLLGSRALRGRLRPRPFTEVLLALRAGEVVGLVVARAAFYASFIAFTWLALPAFGVHVDLVDVAARVPLAMSVAALPLTPGGLGTTQAAFVALFDGLGDPERLLAFALVQAAALPLLRVPLGIALGRRALAPACALALALAAAPGAARASDLVALDGYAEVLREHTTEVENLAGTQVDYPALKRSARWRAVVASLASKDPAALTSREQRLAFWINAYNVLAIDTVVRGYPMRSIREAGSLLFPVWKREAGRVGGRPITLDEIEHGILRPMGDPRIHGAVVCASRSCPALRREPYDPARIDAQLDESVARFLRDGRKGLAIERSANIVRISKVFDWFAEDFETAGGVLAFVAKHAPPDAREWLQAHAATAEIEYFGYDWDLNGP